MTEEIEYKEMNKRMKDLTGVRVGTLEVKKYLGVTKKTKNAVWECKCNCGSIKLYTSSEINKNKNCGCKKDLTGKKFGLLTVLEEKYDKEKKKYYVLCKCDCGNEKWIRRDSIKSGKQKSCGCLSRGTNFKKINLVGKKFNRLTILKEFGKKGSNYTWLCKCDCGNEVVVPGNLLTTGRTKSCGCLAKETASKQSYKAMKVHQDKNIIENTNTAIISRERPMKHNTSGVTGVKWDNSRNKWQSEIYFKNKCYYLGRYNDKEDAIKARKEAEEKMHKEFLRNLEKEDRNGN